MSRYPWTPDLTIDAARAAAIVAARFPELRPVTASYLARGWGFMAFLVNGEWVFRFPMRQDVESAVRKEERLLPALAPWLPIPIPEVRFIGEPGPDFPWRFLGQRLAPGISADRLEPPTAARPRLAAELGRFLARLHEFPVARAGELGLPAWSPRSHVDARERLARAIAQADGLLDGDLLRRCREFAARAGPAVPQFAGEPRFGHHDLGPWHVFLDPGDFHVTAVIDWEDAGIGDPAGDFVGLAMWLGPGFVEEALAHYELPQGGFAERARFLAVAVALLEARYGRIEGEEQCLSTALRALRLNLDA